MFKKMAFGLVSALALVSTGCNAEGVIAVTGIGVGLVGGVFEVIETFLQIIGVGPILG